MVIIVNGENAPIHIPVKWIVAVLVRIADLESTVARQDSYSSI